MAIPSNILTAVKALLLVTDSARDAFIQDIYEQVLNGITNETDWWVEQESLTGVVGQSIYTAQTRVTRILSVLYSNVHLYKVDPISLDFSLSSSWQSDTNGTPEFWIWSKIPPQLDAVTSVTMNQFAIHPAPTSGGAGLLNVLEVATPASDDPTPTWIDPYLIYRTTGEALKQLNEERGKSGNEDDVLQMIQFWTSLADTWKKILQTLIPAQ